MTKAALMKKFNFFLIACVVILACDLPTFLSPSPKTGSADCSNIAITDADLETTLDYGKSMLTTGDWERSYTVQTDQVFATYISSQLNAVVSVNTLALCNARTEVKTYASPENLKIILSNYEKSTQVASCEKDGVLLFQFTAFNDKTDYDINLWVAPLEDPNRALELMVVFPQADPKSMEEYSNAFFPALTACK
jgi:hypothetical protein